MNTLLRVVIATLISTATWNAHAKSLGPTDSLVIRFANRTRLVIYAPDKAGIQALSNYDLNKIVREMGMKLDSVPGGQTAISQGGDRFLKDTVLVVKTDNNTTTVTTEKVTVERSESDKQRDRDREEEERRRRRRHENRGPDIGGSFGLNSFIQQSPTPAFPETDYDLLPLGSRYVALSIGATPTLIPGRYAALKLYYGVEVAWNNFMFDGNNMVVKGNTTVEFPDAGRELQKSKLTVCTIGLPVVPRLTFYNSSGRKVGHFGVGGYINYRLDSYRKIKEADGSTDRRHFDFYLNNYRYGVMAQVGIRSFDFFVKYDISPLFQPGKGPDVRALSFGIGL
ncbi:hypothetical protein IC229_03495 [Spirosoma sp. BT702]|uniref:Outer membrane protein beta-barrel domain-containing protein n=1 Tax=Spirosoma profusum TaxID=2771354 RepID=A0A927ATA4_9BACT|nr:hypothetical protein [Spirosoma profusum]MBD2699687.1 hypothetical protein [Spirosoma profusum]